MADPAYEPTDEELGELSREAFAGVAAANREAQAKLRQTIAALRDAPLPPLREPVKRTA